MTWEDIMQRVLPPIGGVVPHVTDAGAYGAGAEQGRKPPSSIPHRGVDFNYIGGRHARLNRSNPELRSPVAGIVTNAGEGSSHTGCQWIFSRNPSLHQLGLSRLVRSILNQSPAPAYDPGAAAAPRAPSGDANYSGGLLGMYAALAGTDRRDPNQPAPPDDEQEQANIQALEARLSSSGNVNDAWALYNARQAGRR